MTPEQILAALATACAADLSANAFRKYWELATSDHPETIPVGPGDLGQQRLAQVRYLHDSGKAVAFVLAWLEAGEPPDATSRKAISNYLALAYLRVPMVAEPAGGAGAAEKQTIPVMVADAAEKQRILDRWNALLDEGQFKNLFWNVFPRVCCIVGTARLEQHGLPAERSVGGTGFLVGPDVVLTNWHVVENLLDPLTGEARPGSVAEFALFFDHKRQEQINAHDRDWQDTVRVLPARDWYLGGSRKSATREDFTSAFDYALIKLAVPVGRSARNGRFGEARGWLRIPPAVRLDLPRDQEGLVCPQHPDRSGRVFSFGRALGLYKGATSRIAYSLNADHGSSGSPIVSVNGTLLGVHEADDGGFLDGDPKRPHNRGILLTAFADDVRRRLDVAERLEDADGDAAPVTGLWAIRTRSEHRHPLVGREAFLGWIEDQLTEEKDPPVRVIKGETRTGKSFSVDILHARVVALPDIVLSFAATSSAAGPQVSLGQGLLLPEQPDALIVEIAKALELPFDTIPKPPPEVETRPTELGLGLVDDRKPNDWASTVLPRWLADAMKVEAAKRNRRVWIVLDIPADRRLGPAMTSFLNSVSAVFDTAHPFDAFRWIYLEYDPTFLAPVQKTTEILRPKADVTEEGVRDFLTKMFQATGFASPPDDMVDTSLNFFGPLRTYVPEPLFWEALVSALRPIVMRHFPSAEV